MVILLIVALILALIAGGFIGWKGRSFVQRIETLEEIAKRRRLPYPALAGLEDAIALCDDGRFESGSMDKVIAHLLTALEKDVAARKYLDTRFEQVQEVLKKVRSDPQGYDAKEKK